MIEWRKMSFEQNLEKYAALLVNVGLNLKSGDNLFINMTEESLPLARMISKKAYQKGVVDIRLEFSDDEIVLNRFQYAPDKSFKFFPIYRVDFMENLLKDNYNRLSLLTENPDLLKSADPEKIATWQKTAGLAAKPLQK